MRRAVRDEFRKGARQIKAMVNGGVTTPTDAIEGTQFSEDEIRAMVEEVEAANTYVMAHAYTAPAVNRALRSGVRSIEHGTVTDQDSVALLREHDAVLVATMVSVEMSRLEADAADTPSASDGIFPAQLPDVLVSASTGSKDTPS